MEDYLIRINDIERASELKKEIRKSIPHFEITRIILEEMYFTQFSERLKKAGMRISYVKLHKE